MIHHQHVEIAQSLLSSYSNIVPGYHAATTVL